jgi:hypothetical protein
MIRVPVRLRARVLSDLISAGDQDFLRLAAFELFIAGSSLNGPTETTRRPGTSGTPNLVI